jgi:hypothetical protein
MAVSLKQQEIVLEMLRDGSSLTQACHAADISNHARWFEQMEAQPTLHDDYARARHIGNKALADRLRALAADQSIPVNDRRLMVATDQWIIAKMMPKWADRVKVDADITTRGDDLTDEQLQAIIAAKQAK